LNPGQVFWRATPSVCKRYVTADDKTEQKHYKTSLRNPTQWVIWHTEVSLMSCLIWARTFNVEAAIYLLIEKEQPLAELLRNSASKATGS